ncbi:uncharacterized protein LOC135366302 [Ornithodoros turicata]|uniref:uncharacterized protein LOC135366302 n=1 Tax=Ornithodoros turicata TaxID=34597 RepID=UPI003138B019
MLGRLARAWLLLLIALHLACSAPQGTTHSNFSRLLGPTRGLILASKEGSRPSRRSDDNFWKSVKNRSFPRHGRTARDIDSRKPKPRDTDREGYDNHGLHWRSYVQSVLLELNKAREEQEEEQDSIHKAWRTYVTNRLLNLLDWNAPDVGSIDHSRRLVRHPRVHAKRHRPTWNPPVVLWSTLYHPNYGEYGQRGTNGLGYRAHGRRLGMAWQDGRHFTAFNRSRTVIYEGITRPTSTTHRRNLKELLDILNAQSRKRKIMQRQYKGNEDPEQRSDVTPQQFQDVHRREAAYKDDGVYVLVKGVLVSPDSPIRPLIQGQLIPELVTSCINCTTSSKTSSTAADPRPVTVPAKVTQRRLGMVFLLTLVLLFCGILTAAFLSGYLTKYYRQYEIIQRAQFI